MHLIGAGAAPRVPAAVMGDIRSGMRAAGSVPLSRVIPCIKVIQGGVCRFLNDFLNDFLAHSPKGSRKFETFRLFRAFRGCASWTPPGRYPIHLLDQGL